MKNELKEIAKKHSKDELVERVLGVYMQMGEILHLVDTALPDRTGMSAIQLTLLDTAKSKEIRDSAIASLQHISKAYKDAEKEVNNGQA